MRRHAVIQGFSVCGLRASGSGDSGGGFTYWFFVGNEGITKSFVLPSRVIQGANLSFPTKNQELRGLRTP